MWIFARKVNDTGQVFCFVLSCIGDNVTSKDDEADAEAEKDEVEECAEDDKVKRLESEDHFFSELVCIRLCLSFGTREKKYKRKWLYSA